MTNKQKLREARFRLRKKEHKQFMQHKRYCLDCQEAEREIVANATARGREIAAQRAYRWLIRENA